MAYTDLDGAYYAYPQINGKWKIAVSYLRKHDKSFFEECLNLLEISWKLKLDTLVSMNFSMDALPRGRVWLDSKDNRTLIVGRGCNDMSCLSTSYIAKGFGWRGKSKPDLGDHWNTNIEEWLKLKALLKI